MTGQVGDLNWLVEALYLIDFNYKIFYQECVSIGYVTRGMFNVNHLKYMPFDEYECIVKEVESLRPKETINE